MNNPIKDLYEGQTIPLVDKERVALLCVDIQYHDAAPGFGFFKGKDRDEFKYYFDRLDEKVFPTVRKLQDLFRKNNLEVIHVRIESLTKDGRDRSLEHKRIGCHVSKGSKSAEFIPEVAPIDDEIIISKTASGVFNSTNLDYILKNLGITQLVIVGVLTNECIETAVRDGADRSYTMYMVDEGMATFSQELHDNSIKVLNGVYGYLISFSYLEEMIE